ncbi:MAG: HAMP domain-containing sensor histidine kinase [Methylococcus sp.]|nr:HAMP domain-containing sensor histidine kinase [Methylococcus sp.]
MIDVLTLALAAGLGNLAFAVLAAVYAHSARNVNPPLAIWRWARTVAGIAFLLIWLRPAIPAWLSMTVSHLLMPPAWALEFAAYAGLLGFSGWRKPLIGLTALALAAQIALHAFEVGRRIDLIYFSSINTAYFEAMAAVLLLSHQHGRLARMMAFTNAVLGLLFLLRVVHLVWIGDHTLDSYKVLHTLLWVVGYLIVTVNGFGFLLLSKQDDDRRLREALADVSLAEAEQRQLLSLASHEFRTPAAMIQASLDSLKLLADGIPPAAAGRLDNIGKATQRLTHLANTLIAQDRLRELRFGLVRQEADLNAVVAQVAERYAPPIPWRGLDGAARMAVDAELLAIALHNLIDNALRHSAGGGPAEVRLESCGDLLEIAVADRGPGVPDADKEAVFERFYRRDAGPGSGLGLSIVRTIARLHGGEALVRDNAPRGAVFVIRLPFAMPCGSV